MCVIIGEKSLLVEYMLNLHISCSPNAMYTFNMPSFSMEIHAVRPVAKGEEITVSYALESNKAAERQASLKSYGIVCTCAACKDPATSDKERKRAISGLLPKSSQGVEHADAVLAAFEATGLQSHGRYPELLRRVAKIHRKKGTQERAHMLEVLADRVTVAQLGRNPVNKNTSEPSEPTPPIEAPVFTSPEDIIRFFTERAADPSEAMRMIEEFMQNMSVQNQERSSGHAE